MKRCPKCNRDYSDDTLRFCLDDGVPLIGAADTRPQGRESEPPPTAVMYEPSPTIKSAGATIPSYVGREGVRSEQADDRRSNPLLTAGVVAIALLLLALVCIAGFFVLRQPTANEASRTNRLSSPTNSGISPGVSAPVANKPNTPDTSELTNTPLKITASASSIRLAVQSNTYYAANAIDGKRGTAWIEGLDGPGLGEWIRFDFDREINLHRILIQPGYFKSPQIWEENNRIATLTAQFSDGSSRELHFDDRMDRQKVDVGSVKTHWVKFIIKSVYYGTDPDTALSEVAFEWEP